MSGPDQGDEGKSFQDKSFLARWSQRKQEAKQPDRDVPAAEANVAPAPVAEGDVPQEFDLSSLPKLEEITSATDITAFLRKGVPEHLRNAALRKSWALDPAIRNYVNPALDYAYDWNTPGGVPGSSEIGAGMDVARLVSQIMGSGDSVTEPSPSGDETGRETASAVGQSHQDHAKQDLRPDLPTQALRLGNEAASIAPEPANSGEGVCIESGQARDSDKSGPVAPQQPVRRHGSAKPTT
jgi:Protein of unknown function (DUF3306)